MPKKLTYEYVKEWIEENSECKLLSTEYKNNHTKLKFKCKCGQTFERNFNNFSSVNESIRKCDICNNVIKYTIDDVKKFVNENSDCELISTEYENRVKDLMFKCHCGNIFYKSFGEFKDLDGRRCNECGIKKMINSQKHTIEYVKKFIKENSECELLSKEYINAHEPILLKCKCGNTFETDFNHFQNQNKRQCKKCGNKLRNKNTIFAYDDVKKFIESESDCILLSDDYINARTPLTLKCGCGNKFKTTLDEFRNRNRRGCRKCSSTVSRMENKIMRVCEKLKIEFIFQYKLKNCKDIYPLPFDFYLPQYNICIEADGKQHSEPVQFGDMSYEDAVENFAIVKKHDEIKNKYCKDNNIELIRIPYTKFKNIKTILESVLP
jgi:very-short-patch-repair endonuclease